MTEDASKKSRFTRRQALTGLGIGVGAAAVLGSAALVHPYVALIPGRSRAAAVPSDAQLPTEADAVVIGGGDTGVCAALCLAERGLSVALCEKGVIAGEASCRSSGFIESMHLNPAKAQLILRAKELWQQLNARVGGDTGYRQSGLIETLRSEEELASARDWIKAVAGDPRLDPEIASPDRFLRLTDKARARCLGVLHQSSDGIAEPRWMAPVVALAARARGATLHQQCAARGLETSAGRVSAVVTERGRIRTRVVILAGGVWSPLFMGNLLLTLPQLYTFASNESLTPIANGPTVAGNWGRALWRREPDGGFCVGLFSGVTPIGWETFRYGLRYLSALRNMSEIDVGIGRESVRSFTVPRRWPLDARSPFESIRIMEPAPRAGVLEQAYGQLSDVMPVFASSQVRERYAGALCTMPDNMPVISTVDRVPGLVVGSGIYYGLTAAPAVGELLADLATGRAPRVDPHPYRFERFTDGSALTFQP